jgi:hypothetical protein
VKLLRAVLAAALALAAAVGVQAATSSGASAAPDTDCVNCWSTIGE